MDKAELSFDSFLFDVPLERRAFVVAMDEWLMAQNCTRKLAMAKSGYVVSYNDPKTKRVALNYVFRKKGLFARVYADNAAKDAALMAAMNDAVKASVKKSSVCKRLMNPAACSPNCPMGYVLELDGETHKKCRYRAFLFLIDGESEATVEALVRAEVSARLAA